MDGFPLFLISVVVISLSGVLSPGPVLGVTIAKGYSDRNAGALVALGHGILEFPLMILLYLGFSPLFTNPSFKTGVGLLGGALLIYLGFGMIKAMGKVDENSMDLPYGSLAAGVITTGAGPYFWLWWATIGLGLITKAAAYGLPGFVVFMFAHWSCDLVWYFFVSRTVHRSRNIWNEKVHAAVFGLFGLMLMAFGVWFITSAL